MSGENLAHKLLELLDLTFKPAAHFCGSKLLDNLLRGTACAVDQFVTSLVSRQGVRFLRLLILNQFFSQRVSSLCNLFKAVI